MSTLLTHSGEEANLEIEQPHINDDLCEDIDYPSGKLGAMTRKLNEIRPLMKSKSSEHMEKVKKLMGELSEKKASFTAACLTQEKRPNIAEEDVGCFIEWQRAHISTVDEFQTTVSRWLFDIQEPSPMLQDLVQPQDSASQVSSVCSKSSSARARILERKIKLEMQKKCMERQAALKEEELRARNEYEEVKLKLERENNELKIRCEDEEIKELELQLDAAFQEFVGSKEEPTQPTQPTVRENAAVLPHELSRMLINNQALAMLPNNEPETFDGEDITKYLPFTLSFDRTIAVRAPTDADKYYYLLKYTKGRPHDLVLSCNSSDSSLAYSEARKLLKSSYGDEFRIAHSYLERLRSWPSIPSENPVALEEFCTYITTCLNVTKHLNHMTSLNDWKEMKDLLMKLPYELRRQFRTLVARKQGSDSPVNFQLFVDFVREQLDLMKLPLFGEIKDSKGTARKDQRNVKLKTFVTSEDQFQNNKNKTDLRCACCSKKNHVLDDCIFFKKKSLSEREEFIKTKNLCFGCLASSSHRSKDCKQRISCKRCKKLHPTSLHKEYVSSHNRVSTTKKEVSSEALSTGEASDDGTAFTMKVSSKCNSTSSRLVCPAVPVGIRKFGSSEVIYTYMAMDSHATASYIDGNLLKKLGMSGRDTELLVTTMHGKASPMPAKIVENLELVSLDGRTEKTIPKLFAKDNWPFDRKDSPNFSDVESFSKLRAIPFRFIDSSVGLLIGINYPELVRPRKVVSTTSRGPFASKHLFGWAFNGPSSCSDNDSISCLRTVLSREHSDLDHQFNLCFAKDFDDSSCDESYSFEDRKWYQKVSRSIRKLPDGHIEIALPFRDDDICMPNNYLQVLSRLKSLTNRLLKDQLLFEEYQEFMNNMLDSGFAEKVPDDQIDAEPGKVWFLNHHGVRHKQKNKLRIVFDCSLKYQNVSLNDNLLQGPDMTNSLLGVLLRFRQEKIAISGDIEKMFYMVRVPQSDSNYLRFLWFPDHNLRSSPVQYRLNVHVFGAKSSPSCANFALRHSVLSNTNVNSAVRNAVLNSFYVDDLLKSVRSANEAIDLLSGISSELFSNGFNLTAFSSNSREVLSVVDPSKLSKQFEVVDISHDDLPYEKALGVKWNVQSDTIGFRISFPNHPNTKRGILATIFSIYDPYFLTSPVLVPAKKIFQEACHLKLGWDAPLPQKLELKWNSWWNQVNLLNSFEIPRCLFSCLDEYDKVELHIFCDGSETAYGSVAYLRFTKDESVCCSIVMSKVRLTPLCRGSLKTVPRIELNSAKVAVQLKVRLMSELEFDISSVHFWTDSLIVMGYIYSESGRFSRFVANRVAYIRSHSQPDQWRHVPGKYNPADLLSRGTSNVTHFLSSEVWVKGPDFLYLSESNWPVSSISAVLDDDVEVKKSLVTKEVDEQVNPSDTLLNSSSCWYKTKFRVAIYHKFAHFLLKHTLAKVSVRDIENAEFSIFRYIQMRDMKEVYGIIASKRSLPKNSNLSKLDPYLDGRDMLRASGRLKNASVEYVSKFPVLLPKCREIISYVRYVHCRLGHLGREAVLSELRLSVHIVGVTSVIKEVLRKCITCLKIQGRPSEQLMAQLPADRIEGNLPPFTNTGTDYFGPFYVSRGRGKAQEKRYGVIFSCLVSRAVHIEISHSLNTDSFINALRRFVSRRGSVRVIRSDNGTNLVSGEKELKESINQWNSAQIEHACMIRNIDWKFQTANASHHGGVFEREIRTIRKVLSSLLRDFKNQVLLTDELLSTLTCEVENTLNSKPLTTVTTDVNDLEALTPNHLLRLNNECIFPPGLFKDSDVYSKKRWRQVQFLADVFWTRWRKEYLPLLLSRQKWIVNRRSFKVNDLVLVVDQLLPRNMWCVGRIVSVKSDSDRAVRSVNVRVCKHKYGKDFKISSTILERPISKLILLEAVE